MKDYDFIRAASLCRGVQTQTRAATERRGYNN
jgi:hypothetical protein